MGDSTLAELSWILHRLLQTLATSDFVTIPSLDSSKFAYSTPLRFPSSVLLHMAVWRRQMNFLGMLEIRVNAPCI